MIPVFDGHNDVLLEERSFLERSSEGHLDLARAREGGFAGGFFAIFTRHPAGVPDGARRRPDLSPEPPIERPRALAHTFGALGRLLALEAEAPAALRVMRSARDLELAFEGPVVAVAHVEGAEAIDPGLEGLGPLHAAGLRSLGITWSRPNAFGHGVPFASPSSPDTGPGLTEAGRALVRACNELGVLVDLSHLNERGFWDVAGVSRAPLVATHSCAHALCPSARNLTDAQLDAVGESGGVVGVCFSREDLRPTGAQRSDIARHAHHIAERIGVEHVALGSDFDGCELPEGLDDAAGLQGVLDDVRALGWSDEDVRALAHANWLRVLRQVQNAASSRASPTGSS
jgi:membrane dipeptidase